MRLDDSSLPEAIIETAQVIILVLDSGGRIVRFNPYMESLTGYTLAEVRGKDWFETFLPEWDRDNIRALFKTAISGESTCGHVNPIVTKDGRLLQVEWNDKTLAGSDGRALLAIGQDVTERMAVEEERRQSQEELERSILDRTAELQQLNQRLQTVITNAPLVLYSLDRHGIITFIDGKSLDTLGLNPAEMIGQSCFDIYPNVPEVNDALKRALEGNSFSIDIELGEFTFRTQFMPMCDETDKCIGVIGVALDVTEQIEAEQRLQQSEEFLRAIAEAAPDLIVRLDVTGKIEYINRVVDGYTTDDVVGQNFLTWIDPEHHRDPREALDRLVRTGKPQRYEIIGEGPDNEPRWYSTHMSPLIEDGRVRGAVLVSRDTTERRNADQALAASEQKYRQLVENSPYCIHTLDRHKHFLAVNRAGLALLGKQNEVQVTGTSYLDYIAETDRDRVATLIQRAFLGQSAQFEFRTVDGRFMQSSITPLTDNEGHIAQVMGMNMNITERKQAEEKLQASEERYRRAERGTQDGLWEWNIATGEDYFSPRWLEILGYKPGELPEHVDEFAKRIHPEDRARVWDAAERHLQDAARFDTEFRLQRKSGDYVWVRSRGEAERDADGKALLMTGSISDITQQKQAEIALRESQRQLASLIDNLPGIVYRCANTPEWPVTYISDGVREITGYPAQDFLDRTVDFGNLIHPDDAEQVWESIQQALQARKSYQLTYRLIDRVGAVRWLWEQGSGVYSSTGTLVALEGFITDITVRTLAEQALQKSRRQLMDAQRIARLGNWNWDIINDELTWSDEIYRIFGLQPQQFGATYEAFLERVHPDDRTMLEQAVQSALNDRQPYSIDHRIVLPDGETRVVHEQAEVDFSSDGKPIRMAGTVQDITERHAIEHSLRLSAEVIEQVAEGVILVRHSDGSIVYTNRKFDEIFGYEVGELIGKPVTILNANGTRSPEQTAREIFSGVETAGIWSGEIHNVRKDGTEFWTWATVTKFHHDQYNDVLVTVQQDITEQKRIEEELRRSEAKFRMHFENNPIPIFCWQKREDDFYLVEYNPAAERYSGGYVNEMIGGRLSHWYADRPDILQDFEDCIRTGEPVTREMEYVFRTTGEARQLEVRYVHVPPDLVMVHTDDRTFERRMEEEARAQQEQLAHVARLVTLGEMASGIAHEINQPLTAISAFADTAAFLNAERQSTESQRELAQITAKISEQCLRAGAIIHRVLRLSKRSHPLRTTVDLNALAERVLSFLAHDERLKSVTLIERFSENLSDVHVDPVQIEQVVLNLTRNALDAMDDMPAGERILEFRTFDAGNDRVGLSVRDTGKGIADDEISSVFDAFLTSKPDGLGLGLAVSQSIVTAHHGRLDVQQNADRGVTFTVILPADVTPSNGSE